MDADSYFPQFLDNRKAVHNITGETGDGLCQDMLYLPRLSILDHLEHAFPVYQVGT